MLLAYPLPHNTIRRVPYETYNTIPLCQPCRIRRAGAQPCACGSTSRSTYSAAPSNDTAAFSSQDAGDYESYSAESAEAGEGSSFSSDDLTSSMLDPSTVESSRKIVYNASVRMETTDYDTTRAALQEAVTAANGYLESTDQGGSKDSGSRYTYYTARIPAENYRSFLTAAGEARERDLAERERAGHYC